ncbi:MAG: YezD family protein [Bacillota bacterium]|nr:YezD family protein [Bacillota bacterium]
MSEKSVVINSKSISEADLRKLIELLNSISYGSVTLIIQDGRIVQMEKNEKLRLK